MLKKDSQALKDYLNSIGSRYERLWLQEKICKECLVTRYTLQNWKSGMARIPELHKRKIEETIGKNIFSRIAKS